MWHFLINQDPEYWRTLKMSRKRTKIVSRSHADNITQWRHNITQSRRWRKGGACAIKKMTTLLTKQAFFFYSDNKILSLHSGRVLSLLKSAQLITCYVCYWKCVQSDFKIFRPINITLPVSTLLCHTPSYSFSWMFFSFVEGWFVQINVVMISWKVELKDDY